MTEDTQFTRDYIEAGFKLSERDRLRGRFVMGAAEPLEGLGRLAGAGGPEDFLAELLADPEKAAGAAPFFPKILGLTPPADLLAASDNFAPHLLPWAGRPLPRPPRPHPAYESLEPEDRLVLLDYQGRIAALRHGAAVAGAAALFEPFVYRQSWDGRPIALTGDERADTEGPIIRLPRRLDRALVLGFVRAPEIMGMNPGLSKLRPAAGWLDWPGQIAATLKMAEWLAAMGYAALPSAGGLLMADQAGALAGLGEVGRQGLLITPEYGPNLRLFTILTDYPFIPGQPLIFGVADYCETCQRCINECPAKAISEGRRRPGLLYKWPLNRRACFDNWLEKRDPCRKCIEICPYTREPLVGSPGGSRK